MKKMMTIGALFGATLLTGCVSMPQTGQTQQEVKPQVQEAVPVVKKPVQDKKTDYALYGVHRGEKPLVVFQGIIMNIQPFKDESKTFKGINGFLSKLDPTLKLNDPTAKQMMDITIGTGNKQQFHYKQAMDPAFVQGRIILVVQFENGDTVLDPDVKKADIR